MPGDPPDHSSTSFHADFEDSAQYKIRGSEQLAQGAESRSATRFFRKDREGVGGWLTTYLVYLLLGLGLVLFEILPGKSIPADELAMLVLITFAAFSVTRIGKSWVRYLHIAFSGAGIIAVLLPMPDVVRPYLHAFVVLTPEKILQYLPLPWYYGPTWISALIGLTLPLLWTAYWIMSSRVRNTYVSPERRDGTAVIEWDENLNGKRAFAMAWLFATQLVALVSLFPWYIGLPFAAMSVDSGDTELFYTYLSFPVVLLVSVAISWLLYKRRSFRSAEILSGIPIAIVVVVAML